MNHTTEIAELASALVEARKEFRPALKASENPAFRSKYVDLESAVEATDKALAKYGLTVLQMPQTNLVDQSVTITTRLLHKSGQWLEGDLTLPVKGRNGFDAQAVGSAITYGRRYALMALLGISPVDDDGNAASARDGNSVATDNKPIAKKAAKPLVEWDDAPKDKPLVSNNQPTASDFELWHEAFQECSTIEEWNKLIVPMMKERADHPQYGRQFIIAAAEEAKKRGYVGDRASGNYKEGKPKAASIPTVEEYEARYEQREAGK